MLELDEIDQGLIDALQGGFPLVERPFAGVGKALGLAESVVIQRLQRLLENKVLTRFGPMFQIERMGGAFVLAAMAVPEARFDAVAAQVNALPQVAHNYRREHAFNMWFVLATESREGIGEAIAEIQQVTGLTVHAFPKEQEYFVEMRLPVKRGNVGDTLASVGLSVAIPPISPLLQKPNLPTADIDRALILATQGGLPLCPQPYLQLGEQLGIPAEGVMLRLQAMLDQGIIRRIGAVPNHYAIGWTANGMTVWDVADDVIDTLGAQVGALPFVTHCYRRPRALPDWPYNLFAMVHGGSRDEVAEKAEGIARLLEGHCRAQDILYSSRILKKTGLRLQA